MPHDREIIGHVVGVVKPINVFLGTKQIWKETFIHLQDKNVTHDDVMDQNISMGWI